jgi:hypothetical protein
MLSTEQEEVVYMFMDLDVEKQCGFGVNVGQRTATTFERKRKHPVPPVQTVE